MPLEAWGLMVHQAERGRMECPDHPGHRESSGPPEFPGCPDLLANFQTSSLILTGFRCPKESTRARTHSPTCRQRWVPWDLEAPLASVECGDLPATRAPMVLWVTGADRGQQDLWELKASQVCQASQERLVRQG